jgi:hypothetical protein
MEAKFNDDVLYGELLFTLLGKKWNPYLGWLFLTEPYQEDVNTIINTIKMELMR